MPQTSRRPQGEAPLLKGHYVRHLQRVFLFSQVKKNTFRRTFRVHFGTTWRFAQDSKLFCSPQNRHDAHAPNKRFVIVSSFPLKKQQAQWAPLPPHIITAQSLIKASSQLTNLGLECNPRRKNVSPFAQRRNSLVSRELNWPGKGEGGGGGAVRTANDENRTGRRFSKQDKSRKSLKPR